MTRQMGRVNETLRDALGVVILRELRDPRVAPLTSITSVATSPDLQRARVFVSVLGSPEEQTATVAALQAASGFLRRTLFDRLRIRRMPELVFHLDTSIDESERLSDIIERAAGAATAEGDSS